MQDQELAELIGQTGPLDDRIIEIVALGDANDLWAARFEHLDVLIANMPEEQMIGFFATIDGPKDDVALPAYRAMMAANALWRTTGGLRFSLVTDAGIELSMTLAAVDITPRLLADCTLALAGHTASWALIFSGAVPPPAPEAIAPAFDPSLIRV